MTLHTHQARGTLAILLVLVVASLACATTGNELNVATQVALTLGATTENQIEATTSPSCTTVDFNGISLCYDPSIAQGALTEVVPAVSNPDAIWYDTPQTEQINFTGYITGEKFHDPRIMVFSVNEYRAIQNRGGETITALQQYLANKPNIPAGSIPFLPIFNAAQIFNTMPAFVSFQNGQGIRFLTEYGQYSAPVNNTDLFYTFQGLTNDGNYYVSVILPVTHPSLPPDYNIDAALQQELYNDYEGYLAGILPNLSSQPLNSFTPDISLLDAMIQSMKIH